VTRATLARAAVAIAVVLALTAPATALAWSNGPGGDGFGTHDWILYEAARVARVQGHDWVDLAVALPMTDDPDSRLHDFYYHVYQVGGKPYGGSPTMVARLYGEAVAELRTGDRTAASRTVGLLAHYFGDTNNPLHTDQTKAESPIHSRYETAADKRTDAPGENAAWVVVGPFVPVADVRALTVQDAEVAHRSYSELVSEFAAHGFDARVEAITRESLARAVTGMADILGSIEIDAKYAPAPAGGATRPPAERGMVPPSALVQALAGGCCGLIVALALAALLWAILRRRRR
jgi:hypothetical protein